MLAVMHYFSIQLFLYWRYWWLDIPMHFLGGMTVALGYLAVRDFFPSWQWWPRAFWPALGFVLLVAAAWEVFEVVIGISIQEKHYVEDTLTDLAMGILGGMGGYLLARRVRRRIGEYE